MSFDTPEHKVGFVVLLRTAQILVVTLGLALFCLPAFAQLNLGRIFGAVTDQSGGAIAAATITVIDIARGVSRPLVSDGAGEYQAPSLTPGTYTVRAEAKGFKIAEHTDIAVGVGQEVRVDLTLQPGEQTQTITVTGDLPMVNTANAQLGGTLEQMAVEELPVEGRNYQYLIGTRPGMIVFPTQGQYGTESDGIDYHYSAWMIDGILNTNQMVGGPSLVGGSGQNGDEATILPLDAIQEVDMVSNPTAVYGTRPGAHVNVGLKSGTNSLHGTAYAYGKDGGWAARNPFLNSSLPKQPLALEQYGASIGGPIKKDKIFYFATYEGQRYAVGVPRIAQEPTTATGSGAGNSTPDAIFDILHNAANTTSGIAGSTPIVPPSALSLNLAGCSALVPAGTVAAGGYLTASQISVLQGMSASQLASGCSGGTSIFGNSGPNQNVVTDFTSSGGSDNGIMKVDVHPNDHHALNFEWFSGGGNIISAGSVVQPYWSAHAHNWANLGRAVWIWTPNSTWLNEFRFGYDYGNVPVYVYECDKPGVGPNYASAYGFNAGTYPCTSQASKGYNVLGGFPLLTVSGFTGLGPTNGNTQDGQQHYYTELDNVTWTHGKHVVTFGAEIRELGFLGDVLANGRGTLSFGTTSAWAANSTKVGCVATACAGATALQDFLTGVTTSGALLVGNALRNYSRPNYGIFVQDAWRILPRLTVNAGIRWEYAGVVKDTNLAPGQSTADQIANWNPALGTATGLFQETSTTNLYKPEYTDFGPRVGIAWDVFGKGKTIVHLGGGVMYESAPRFLNLIYTSGAIISSLPTGFTFVNPNASTFAGPGNIATGTISQSGGIPASAGNPTGSAGNSLPWTIGNPVFNVTPSGLRCGNGQAASLAGGPTGVTNPPPCVIQGYDIHNRRPYYFTRTLNVEHAFTNNLSVTIAYVGNRGGALETLINENVPSTGIKNTSTNGYIEQARRPYASQYPFYSNILVLTHGGQSNYDALQVSLTQRISHGLNFTAGYTLSHAMDMGQAGSPMNPLNPVLDYGNSTNNTPNDINFTITYLVPGIKTPGQILQGWQVNTSTNFLQGFSAASSDTSDDISGTGGLADRWTMSAAGNPHSIQLGGPGAVPCFGIVGSSFAKAANCADVAAGPTSNPTANMPALCVSTAAAESVNSSVPTGSANATGLLALASLGCYFQGNTAIVPPAQGTYGTMARDELYGHHYFNWDFSLTKNWKFRERYGIQFRAEFFNILNHSLYGGAGTNLSVPTSFGEATATPDSGNAVIGNGPRKLQLGLKISF